jgi:Calx-beta domain-containing protein
MKTRVSSSHWWYLLFGLLTLAVVRPAVAQVNNSFSTVTIHATDSRAGEGGSDGATFTVRRTGPTNVALLVFFQLGGTAANGVDYDQITGPVQISAGEFATSFTVWPVDDTLVEGDETVLARITESPLACATCGYRIGAPSNAVVTIADNDLTGTNQPPFVRLNEPQNGALFTAPANVTLRAFAQDAEDHYDLRVEFFEGMRSLGFGTFVATTCPAPYCPFYQLIWSNAPPGRYVLTARATDSAGATSVSDLVTITVIDSNASAVNIYATDPVATEQPAASNIPPDTATFTVRRSGGTDLGIVVFYEISGTASNGVDYQRLSGHVSIPEGASSAEIVVGPIDDNVAEGPETVMLTLIPPCPPCLFMNPPCEVAEGTNCFPIGPDNRAVAQIRDNDTIGTNRAPYVRLIAPQNGDVFPAPADIRLVAYAQDAEDGYTLKVEFFEGTTSLGFGTFLPGRCAVCPNYVLIWSNAPPGRYILTAQATDSDGAASLSEPVYIAVFGSDASTVNIYATDPAAAEQPAVSTIPPDTATFTVRRSGDTSTGIVVFYEISGTASNGVDYQRLSGHVSIPEGASSAEIIVGPIDDNLVEGTEEVVLTLIPPCPPCLFMHPPCLLPQGTNCYPIGRDNRAVAYIRDNDQANITPVVDIVARDPFASEGRNFWRGDGCEWASDTWNSWNVNIGGTNTATFVVRRHGPTNDNLTVNYEIGGTASNGLDYVALSGSVTIPAGRRSAQIVIVPIDDTLAEDIETVVLKLRPSTEYALGLSARASAIIVDNDRPRPHCVLLSDRQFHLCLPATNGFCFRIEAATDLVHWTPLCTNVVTDGALHFVDPDAPSSDVRFYRVVEEPGLSPDD